MQCPVCKIDLVMSERQGIEIDYCSTCRGVWLDRGELDKIIEKSQSQPNETQVQPRIQQQGYSGKEKYHDSYGNKKHRKKSFFEELFD